MTFTSKGPAGPHASARTAGAVAVAVLVAGCGGASSASSASAPDSPSASSAPTSPPAAGSLASVALTVAEATQYGSQPVTAGPPPSTGIGTGLNATLDLCDASFASEAQRAQRYQVSFVTVDGQQRVADSNEIVRYRPGGATRAYREVVNVAHHCQAMSRDGVRVSKPSIEPDSAKLVAHQLTVAFTETHGGQTVDDVAVYQFQGDWFDGVYVTRGSATDALDAARNLAAVAAGKLRRAAAGS